MKHIDIHIIGSNPSEASPDNTPFHKGTRSRKTIDSWFSNVDYDYKLKFANIVNYKKPGNKPLTTTEIKNNIDIIQKRFRNKNAFYVAVGKDAQRALDAAGIRHFKMPHPSGLNHFWNDKVAAEARIKEMHVWLKNSHCQKVKKLQNQ